MSKSCYMMVLRHRLVADNDGGNKLLVFILFCVSMVLGACLCLDMTLLLEKEEAFTF